MKRIFLIISLAILLNSWSSQVLADNGDISKKKLDELLPPIEVPKGTDSTALPSADFKTGIIPQAISILLMLAGSVTFAVFVYAGVMLVIAQGNEEDITKFKNILIWSLIGLAFITTAYALVRGVMQIVFK